MKRYATTPSPPGGLRQLVLHMSRVCDRAPSLPVAIQWIQQIVERPEWRAIAQVDAAVAVTKWELWPARRPRTRANGYGVRGEDPA